MNPSNSLCLTPSEFIGLVGLGLDIIGAIIIILPSLQFVRSRREGVPFVQSRHREFVDQKEALQDVFASLIANGKIWPDNFNSGDLSTVESEKFDIFVRFLRDELEIDADGHHSRGVENVSYRDGKCFIVYERDEGQNETPENSDKISKEEVGQEITQYLARKERYVDRVFITVGVLFLIAGFSLQIVSLLGNSG